MFADGGLLHDLLQPADLPPAQPGRSLHQAGPQVRPLPPGLADDAVQQVSPTGRDLQGLGHHLQGRRDVPPEGRPGHPLAVRGATAGGDRLRPHRSVPLLSPGRHQYRSTVRQDRGSLFYF